MRHALKDIMAILMIPVSPAHVLKQTKILLADATSRNRACHAIVKKDIRVRFAIDVQKDFSVTPRTETDFVKAVTATLKALCQTNATN